jgi:hypothetical protein
MNRFFSRNELLIRLSVLIGLIAWSGLLLHTFTHHDSKADHCLLCSSAQSFTGSVAPLVSVAFVLVGFVFKSETAALVAKIATPSIPRSPPCMLPN